jgi:hypothetical protein
MCRREAVSLLVEKYSGQKTGLGLARLTVLALPIAQEQLLHLIPFFPLNDRLMLARVDGTLVSDLAGVDVVPENLIQAATGEAVASGVASIARAGFGPDRCSVEMFLQRRDRTESEVLAVDFPDALGFLGSDVQLPVP